MKITSSSKSQSKIENSLGSRNQVNKLLKFNVLVSLCYIVFIVILQLLVRDSEWGVGLLPILFVGPLIVLIGACSLIVLLFRYRNADKTKQYLVHLLAIVLILLFFFKVFYPIVMNYSYIPIN